MLLDLTSSKSRAGNEGTKLDAGERLWILASGGLIVLQLWLAIGTSLWRDETGTWWAVAAGAQEAFHRAFYWGGTSPLYYVTVAAFTRVTGLNEVTLRLPSLFAIAGATCFLFRIAERLYDRASAAVVALVFLCLTAYYAIDARPYALAMLGLTASTWAMIRWLESRKFVHAILYVTASAFVVYAHYIMALSLAPGAIFAIAFLRRKRRDLARLGGLFFTTIVLCLPVVPHLRFLTVTRAAHSLAGIPLGAELLQGFMPGTLSGVLIVAVFVYQVWRGNASLPGKCTGASALLVATWSLFAPVFLFLLPVFGNYHFFLHRYYSSTLPGQALLLGGLISSIRPGIVRKALLLMLAIGTVLANGRYTSQTHGNEDWRSALAFLKNDAGAPVLFQSGFVEASDFAILRDPELHEVLFAPQFVYGSPAVSIPLPNCFNGNCFNDKLVLEMEQVFRQVEHAPRFFLLRAEYDRAFELWLLGRLGPSCKSDFVRNFGELYVTQFTCASSG